MPEEEKKTMEEALRTLPSRPLREKYWSEIGIEEKVERMRREVKSLKSFMHVLSDKIDRLLEHSHLEGKIVIPLDRYGRGGEENAFSAGGKKDDVYF